MNHCEKKELHTCFSVISLLLAEMLKQCQRAPMFLHLRHDFRPLYFGKCTPFVWNTLSFSCLLEEFLNYLFNPRSGVISFRKTSLTPPARVKLLDVGTVDILSPKFCAVRGMAVTHIVGCLAASLCSSHVDVDSTWPAATIKGVSRYSHPWGAGKGKVTSCEPLN